METPEFKTGWTDGKIHQRKTPSKSSSNKKLQRTFQFWVWDWRKDSNMHLQGGEIQNTGVQFHLIIKNPFLPWFSK